MRTIVRARSAALAALLACATVAAPDAGPGPQRIPTVSRAAMLFAGFERDLGDALRTRDAARLKRLLAEDFEQRDARAPDTPTPRADWLAHLPPALADAEQERFAVHDYGDTAVVSFALVPQATDKNAAAPYFVVDVWRKAGEYWQLAVRYIGADGAGIAYPGSAPAAAPPKKI
ncbi:MAG: nuclear transport factor 2 family protein [Mizugakiibacter sp.]|uniref:nuclear transport factor 2 family protein n=1 Tax=Mizugakiibacter sp. TaxID=1972610 RepID=UPI00320EFE3A